MVEGEYEPKTRKLWLFDLPDHPGSYDERVRTLAELVARLGNPSVVAMPRTTTDFRFFYDDCRRSGFEGIVAKRRASLYAKCSRPHTVIRDWIKRRFTWD